MARGSIVAATIILGRLLQPFEHAIEGWHGWGQAIGAYRRLRTTLEDTAMDRQTTPVAVGTPCLTVEGMSFMPTGADRAVLKGVNFALDAGEVVIIVGPSGSGKSTLARLIVGLWAPSTGGVFLDGQNVALWERSSFGEATGYLPQNSALLHGSIGENIARFREVDPRDVIAAARRVGAHEMIGRLPLGYETRLGDSGFALSGGQQQRVGLARAFFGGPSLIVLDEPNTHLDGEAEQDLIRIVDQARSEGTTVVVVSHRPAMLQVADKVLVLREGMVASFGPPEDAKLGTRALIQNVASGDGKVTRLPPLRVCPP